MTGDVGFDDKAQAYSLTEETRRFAAVIGSPGARDVSLMPYQEEPRDVPVRFMIDVPGDGHRAHLRAHRHRGQRRGARDGQGHLRAPARDRARALYAGNVALLPRAAGADRRR